MLDNILSQILYVISGFLFGIFACRFSIFFTRKIKEAWSDHGFSLSFLMASIPGLLFLAVSVFVFPIWFSTRTQAGAFVYMATLIYYTARNRNKK